MPPSQTAEDPALEDSSKLVLATTELPVNTKLEGYRDFVVQELADAVLANWWLEPAPFYQVPARTY